MTYFTVIDAVFDEVILEGATKEEVKKRLNIKDNTFYTCISERRLCRRKFKIVPEYGEKIMTTLPPDFRNRWRAMQRLFGIAVEEDTE